LQQRGRPTSARHARSDRRAGLAAGHAPRRAGPEPGAAALVGGGRGRHQDGNDHNHPPANGRELSRRAVMARRATLTSTTQQQVARR